VKKFIKISLSEEKFDIGFKEEKTKNPLIFFKLLDLFFVTFNQMNVGDILREKCLFLYSKYLFKLFITLFRSDFIFSSFWKYFLLC
jgi:hypothetical protein